MDRRGGAGGAVGAAPDNVWPWLTPARLGALVFLAGLVAALLTAA